MSKRKFTTETGCTVRVYEDAILGSRTLLSFRMEQPGDGRYAEVRLTNHERKLLIKALKRTPRPKVPKIHPLRDGSMPDV